MDPTSEIEVRGDLAGRPGLVRPELVRHPKIALRFRFGISPAALTEPCFRRDFANTEMMALWINAPRFVMGVRQRTEPNRVGVFALSTTAKHFFAGANLARLSSTQPLPCTGLARSRLGHALRPVLCGSLAPTPARRAP
jgi:hypothetical protein